VADRNVDVMYALDALLDVAYHDGTRRDLAVAAEAWTLAGYHDGSIDVAHGGGCDAILERVAGARRGLPRRLLRADARGMLTAVTALVEAGVFTHREAAEATRQRWLARGGHSGPNATKEEN
jgi:hypothetical protein